MGSPHGSIHLWLGGALDCDPMYNKIGSLVGSEIAEALAYLSVGHRRLLFCGGTWSCVGEKASVDVKPEEVSRRTLAEGHRMAITLNAPAWLVARTLRTILTGQFDFHLCEMFENPLSHTPSLTLVVFTTVLAQVCLCMSPPPLWLRGRVLSP